MPNPHIIIIIYLFIYFTNTECIYTMTEYEN